MLSGNTGYALPRWSILWARLVSAMQQPACLDWTLLSCSHAVSSPLLRTQCYEQEFCCVTFYAVLMMQAMRREIAEQLVDRPWYTSGSTLQVSRLTAPRVVLLGDAAHAVSAAFGQGVNSALEVGSRGGPHAVL